MSVSPRIVAAAFVGAAMLVACGGDDEPTPPPAPPSVTCRDFADVSGMPSFADDVMPIFGRSCALSASCHQTPMGQEGLVLGQSMADGEPDQALVDQVHTAIVGGASTQSSFALVEPGDPATSYLLLKMAYSLVQLDGCDIGCEEDCGDPMPSPIGGVEVEDVDTVAAWIASGAPNN